MLQWMGGARRKMKSTKDSKLKRQREFFDHHKEKRRRKDFGEDPGKVHTLADYIRQNLRGGESLDILGLRSLNPTTAAYSDASLPDPATAALRPNSGGAGGVTPTISNLSASSVGVLEGDTQDTSSQQPECKTKSRGIIQESEQEIKPCAQNTSGVAAAAQQEIQELVNRNTEIPLPRKGRNPIHVGNLQTKKVASTPRLKLLDMIRDDNKGDNRRKKRLSSEAYAVFSQDGNDAIKENIFDQGVLHAQQTFITSDSVADWDGTNHLLNSSLQLKNSYDSYSETLDTGTSDLLSRFLSTQKLKSLKGRSSRQHGRHPQERNVTKDHLLDTESLSNSCRVTHDGGHDLDFYDPAFNMTNAQAKESREINFFIPLFDIENFHVNEEPQEFDISDPFVTITNHQMEQEPQEFDISDPFVTITNHQMEQERQECRFPDLFVYTMNNQVKQERLGYGYLNPGFNVDDHQVTADLSSDRCAFIVDSNFFHQKKGSDSPEKNPVTWNNDISLTLPNFKREFPTLDHFWSVQVPSSDRSLNSSHQFRTYDKFPNIMEDFYLNLENRGLSDVKFEKLQLPSDGFVVESQHIEADFSSPDDFSPRRRRANQSNFESEALDLNDDGRKKCTSSEWKYEHSATRDLPRHQENIGPAHSGGNSDQTNNINAANSWFQTVDGGTTDHFSDYLISGMDVMQGKDLFSATQATIAPETLQDLKPIFLPQINNGDEDFIIVCFPDNEDCSTVNANTIQLPIQPGSIPLQMFGTVESSSGMEHDINDLSSETPFNRISQEIDDSCVSGQDITAAGATTITLTHHNLILEGEGSDCDKILRTSRQSQMDHRLLLNSASSLGKSTEVISWHVKEPQHEAYSELQSSKSRRSSSNFLAKEGEIIEDGLEHHSSTNDRADQCLSSNVLYDHASRHEMTHNVEENSVEVLTPPKEPLPEDRKGMSTTEAVGMLQKRLWTEDAIAHDCGCRASFSSQEECSPACQLNTVQAVLRKLQRPVFSCGPNQEQGIKTVDTVLLKLQRPARHSIHGLGHQEAEANRITQKDIKRKSDMNQKSNLESETKTTAECQVRSLTYHNTSGSRGSLPVPNASKPISLQSSKKGEDKRGLSEISTQRNKEARLSLDDIDAIASSDHRFSNQPCQSKSHSLPSIVLIKEVADSSVPPAGDAKQYSTPVSQRNPVSEAPDREQPSRRDFDPPVSHTGGLESPSNTPQASERQKIMRASKEQEGLRIINQHNAQPDPEKDFQQGRGPTTSGYDAAYVKMLESYVVQLKLENNLLRLTTG